MMNWSLILWERKRQHEKDTLEFLDDLNTSNQKMINMTFLIELYINDDKEMFDQLYIKKDKIESELGLQLDWQRLDDKKASRIMYRIPGLNFDDHSNYDTLMNDIIDKVVLFVKVFKKYIK